MCGLTGVISDWLSDPEIGSFRQLMVLSSLRGRDGSGIVVVPQAHNKDVELIRSKAAASDIAYDPVFAKVIKANHRSSTLMGHARLPTTGGLEERDIHPHRCGNIIGMHNGTMERINGRTVGKKDNDSRMLFESISKDGFDETIQNSTGDLALSWLDLGDGTLHFYRNTKRPLFFGSNGSWNTVWWASEAEMLYFVLERTYGDNAKVEVLELPPFHHLTFKARPGVGQVRPIKDENITFAGGKKSSVPLLPKPKVVMGGEDKCRYITHNGLALNKSELVIALASGCGWCRQPHSYDDYLRSNVKWVGHTEYICKECVLTDPNAADWVLAHTPTLGAA